MKKLIQDGLTRKDIENAATELGAGGHAIAKWKQRRLPTAWGKAIALHLKADSGYVRYIWSGEK